MYIVINCIFVYIICIINTKLRHCKLFINTYNYVFLIFYNHILFSYFDYALIIVYFCIVI